jgi:hypothetical protein
MPMWKWLLRTIGWHSDVVVDEKQEEKEEKHDNIPMLFPFFLRVHERALAEIERIGAEEQAKLRRAFEEKKARFEALKQAGFSGGVVEREEFESARRYRHASRLAEQEQLLAVEAERTRFTVETGMESPVEYRPRSVEPVAQFSGGVQPASPEAKAVGVPAPKKDVATDDPEKRCNICLVHERCCAAVPCGHMLFCNGCARTYVNKKKKDEECQCPNCRAPIVQIVQIYV